MLATAAAEYVDYEKLLWIPGGKKIFIPSHSINMGEIVALEYERILPKIRVLFERDDIFYKLITKGHTTVNYEQMKIPLIYNGGE